MLAVMFTWVPEGLAVTKLEVAGVELMALASAVAKSLALVGADPELP